MEPKKTREQLVQQVRETVKRIKIYKRGTPEGEAQREAFRIRWGMRPEDL